VKASHGFHPFDSAVRTLHRIETVNMIRKENLLSTGRHAADIDGRFVPA
jgi:hypothetical protein